MFSLIRGEDVPGRLVREVPALTGSVVIAEYFYRLHSFSLECLAFLGTWFVLSAAAHMMFPLKRQARTSHHTAGGGESDGRAARL